MAKIKSFGARVYVNGIAVGGLTDISASGTDVSMVDTTSHDSAGGYRTFLAGLKDGGTLELTGKYDYGNVGQAEWKAEEGVAHDFYILLSDNSGFAFSAIVGGFKTSNPLDDAVEFTADARITGPVYPVFPTITVTGTLTSDGSTPLTFGAFTLGAIDSGGLVYSNNTSDTINATGGIYTLLDDSTGAEYVASAASLVPQGQTYVATSPATGTPTLTGS